MKWFGVKTIYATYAVGKSKHMDLIFNKSSILLEERVVVLRASNSSEAIKKAEKEANQYAGVETRVNCYGQRVYQKYLNACEAFELYDKINNNIEVFSSTRVIDKRMTLSQIKDLFFGVKKDKKNQKKRIKFLEC